MPKLSLIPLSLLLFLTISLFIPKINGFSTNNIQQQLSDRQVYHQIHQSISQHLGEESLIEDQDINQLVRQTISPEYIQNKANATMTDSADWITGRTQTTPTISFNDLKQAIIDQHPEAEQAINEALSQLDQVSNQSATPPQITDDQTAQNALNQLANYQPTLTSFSQGDTTVHLQPVLQPLKLSYSIYSISLIALPVILLVVLAIYIFKQPTIEHKLRAAGRILFTSGLVSAALFAINQLLWLNWLLPQITLRLDDISPLASQVGQSITTPLLHNYLLLGASLSLSLAVIGGIFLLLGHYLAKKSTTPINANNPAPTPTETKDNTNSKSETVDQPRPTKTQD